MHGFEVENTGHRDLSDFSESAPGLINVNKNLSSVLIQSNHEAASLVGYFKHAPPHSLT